MNKGYNLLAAKLNLCCRAFKHGWHGFDRGAHFDTAPADSRNKKRGRRSEVGKNRENQLYLSPSLPPFIQMAGTAALRPLPFAPMRLKAKGM